MSGRVFELRELGLRIDVRQERPGSYRYQLVPNAASERLLEAERPERIRFETEALQDMAANGKLDVERFTRFVGRTLRGPAA